MAWILALLAVLYASVRYFEWSNFYVPRREWLANPGLFGLEYEDVTFISEDGRVLSGWWVPHPAARGALIYCHGNACNIGDLADVIATLRRLRLHLFVFDYRGYGKSRGIPTEQGTYRDARAAYEVVRARYEDAESPPVLAYGHSLGGPVALQLALDKPVRGVITEGAFSSSLDIGRLLYPGLPLRHLLHFKYDAAEKAAAVRVPKLFAHSPDDRIIPYELGQKLYHAAAEPKTFVLLKGDHSDNDWTRNPEAWSALEAFVEGVLGP